MWEPRGERVVAHSPNRGDWKGDRSRGSPFAEAKVYLKGKRILKRSTLRTAPKGQCRMEPLYPTDVASDLKPGFRFRFRAFRKLRMLPLTLSRVIDQVIV